jgi:hypothetical protein
MKIKNSANFDGTRILSNGLSLTSIDYQSSTKFLEVIINENLDSMQRPIIIGLDLSDPFNGEKLKGKKIESDQDIILGVLTNKIVKIGDRARLVTKGILEDDFVSFPSINKKIYADEFGNFSTEKQFFRFKNLGKIISLSPTALYIDVNNELQYDQNYENYEEFEFRKLENALRKLNLFFGRWIQDKFSALAIPDRFVPVHVASNKSQIIAINNDMFRASNDLGATWQIIPIENQTWSQIIYAQNKFVAVSPNKIAHSENGIDWTISASAKGTSIAYGDGKFVTVGTTGSYQSSDGINWSPNSGTLYDSVAYGNGIFVATNGTSTGVLNNVAVWGNTIQAIGIKITFGIDKFIAIKNDGTLNYSYDGVGWFLTGEIDPTYPAAYQTYTVSYFDGLFLCVGYLNDTMSNTSWYSFDGIKWFGRNYTVDFNGKVFLLRDGQTISFDGTTVPQPQFVRVIGL